MPPISITFVIMKNLVIILSFLLLVACGNSKKTDNAEGNALNLEYAKGIVITDHGKYITAEVKNPWKDGALLQTYILVPRDKELPKGLPEGTIVRIPIKRALVYSSVHCNVIHELTRSYNSIAGVCDAQYFKIPAIVDGVKSGKVADCGNSMSPTIEKVVELNPDAILLSPFQNSGYGALTATKIPIIECADYMEQSPLGRAEWIKFFGLLFGHEEHAESIFLGVKNKYLELKKITANCERRPKILTETITNGVWYVPGGKSYMARMISDAGGDFPWKDTDSSGSIPLDFSKVFEKAYDADIWLIKTFANDASLDDIANIDSRNVQFEAFKSNNILVCNTATSPLFEEFPFHPDRLLEEFIAIFHPELIKEYHHKYYFKVKQ